LSYISCEIILKSSLPIPDYKLPEEHFLLLYSTIKKIKKIPTTIIIGMHVIKYNYLQTMYSIYVGGGMRKLITRNNKTKKAKAFY